MYFSHLKEQKQSFKFEKNPPEHIKYINYVAIQKYNIQVNEERNYPVLSL